MCRVRQLVLFGPFGCHGFGILQNSGKDLAKFNLQFCRAFGNIRIALHLGAVIMLNEGQQTRVVSAAKSEARASMDFQFDAKRSRHGYFWLRKQLGLFFFKANDKSFFFRCKRQIFRPHHVCNSLSPDLHGRVSSALKSLVVVRPSIGRLRQLFLILKLHERVIAALFSNQIVEDEER
uniref:Uncharacterized protein n=1 Tax=Spongospora subterranea TaxID=70186 RepID=A0A0H5QJA9_9EUKA|eukprot:CRZ02088.1 hypothetical protein [Spongospora subterranea]